MKASVSVVAAAFLTVAGPAAAAASPPPVATGVPDAFLGEWHVSRAQCGKETDDSRLVISSTEVRFYESGGPIDGVMVNGPREVAIATRLSGEGETWTDLTTFRLSADGRSLTDVSVPSEPHPIVRVRCPAS